jgi:hypothetical protein
VRKQKEGKKKEKKKKKKGKKRAKAAKTKWDQLRSVLLVCLWTFSSL